MSEFRAGKVDRSKMGFWRHLAPIQSVHSLGDVTPEDLIAAGKKLVLVDVDNTLVAWRSEEIPASTITWLGLVKDAGLKLCIISNTKKVARLRRLSTTMDIPFLLGRFKPSRRMFRQALADFAVTSQETVMIGDQLFTDILGANRTGIDAIWVKQMAPRDFVGTKISRVGERIVRGRIHKAMKTELEGVEEDLPIGGTAAFELLQSPVVRQFVKFCIVGGSSTVIDIGLFWFMRFYLRSGDHLVSEDLGSYLMGHFPGIFSHISRTTADASVPVFKVLSTIIATLNSFLWNRRWTFRIQGKEHRSVQLQKFFAVSIVGLILNTVITTGLNNVIAGHAQRGLAIATGVATVVVAFWNFFGQKHWTFKSHG